MKQAEIIKNICRKHDIKQIDLAGILKTDRSNVSNWVNGRRKISGKFVWKLLQLGYIKKREVSSLLD